MLRLSQAQLTFGCLLCTKHYAKGYFSRTPLPCRQCFSFYRWRNGFTKPLSNLPNTMLLEDRKTGSFKAYTLNHSYIVFYNSSQCFFKISILFTPLHSTFLSFHCIFELYLSILYFTKSYFNFIFPVATSLPH